MSFSKLTIYSYFTCFSKQKSIIQHLVRYLTILSQIMPISEYYYWAFQQHYQLYLAPYLGRALLYQQCVLQSILDHSRTVLKNRQATWILNRNSNSNKKYCYFNFKTISFVYAIHTRLDVLQSSVLFAIHDISSCSTLNNIQLYHLFANVSLLMSPLDASSFSKYLA